MQMIDVIGYIVHMWINKVFWMIEALSTTLPSRCVTIKWFLYNTCITTVAKRINVCEYTILPFRPAEVPNACRQSSPCPQMYSLLRLL